MMETVSESSSDRQAIWMTYKSGISRNSLTAIFYAMLVFTPAQIYMTLMTGGGVGAVTWFTLFLWIEFMRLGGGMLTKQEAFFILAFSTTATFPLSLIQWAWFRESDVAITLGIVDQIPDWKAPHPSLGILELRTFFHPAWIAPIGVALIASAITFILGLGLNLFAREMYIEAERLPFPIQQMQGQGLSVLTESIDRSTERKKIQMYIFSISAILGFAYSLVLYTVPAITQALTGVYTPLIPVPFVDLTPAIETMMPGAILGIGTTLTSFTLGWFIPFRIVLGMFLGALAVGLFGNWFSVIFQWVPDTDPILPGYQSWWLPGMGIPMIMARSTLFFWTSIFLGAGFALGLAPIMAHPRRFVQTLKSLSKPRSAGARSPEERILEPISFSKIILPLILVGTAGTVALYWILVPGFVPMFPWMLLFMLFLPILSTMITARLIGTVGTSSQPLAQVAYVPFWTAQITYPGLNQWFAPSIWDNVVGDPSLFKACQIMETRDLDYVKLYIILWPISIIVGYLYMEVFWSIAPIPSGRWPATAIYWPQWATQFGVTIRGLMYGLLRIDWLIYVFIALLALYILLDLAHSPIPYIAIAAGIGGAYVFGSGLPSLITAFIGAVSAHIIRLKVGSEWWYENRYTVGAGITTGTAIAVTMAVAISMIVNAVWVLPF